MNKFPQLRIIAFALILLSAFQASPQSPDDQYVLGPDSQPRTDVPQGEIVNGVLKDSKIYPHFEHAWWLYVPKQYDGTKPLPLMTFLDGQSYLRREGRWRVPVVFDNLIAKHELPVMAALFVNPGESPEKDADGKPLNSNRSVEYDSLNADYANFLLQEIFPEVRKHIRITDSPEGRGLAGGSSGGICAFTAAWERPDQFRKVLSFYGSFVNIRGGGAYPQIIRQSQQKPIRIFQQDGAGDALGGVYAQFDWPAGNKAVAAALDEKGYDHRFEFGQGTHNSAHGASIFPEVMRWAWRDYPTAADPSLADSVNSKERTVTKLADGIYVIRHKDSPDGNVNGNTTVIIGDREVFVVDSCFQLSAAREDIAQIKQWTNKPVRYLLITHFHNDHNMGSGLYAAAFPGIAIVAQIETKQDMYRTPNTPGRFVEYVNIRQQRLASGKDAEGKPLTPDQIKALQVSLAGKKQILEELKDFVYVPPNLTFDHELDIDLGNRELQVLHAGRGTTSGDTVVYLPKEKILVAGDLLTHPVLFTYDGYPSDWVRTLESLSQLETVAIVPGHGNVLTDKSYLFLARDLLQSAITQVNAALHTQTAKLENPPLESIKKEVDLSSFREKFAGTDKDNLEAFDDAAAALVKIVYNEARHNY